MDNITHVFRTESSCRVWPLCFTNEKFVHAIGFSFKVAHFSTTGFLRFEFPSMRRLSYLCMLISVSFL